MLVWLLDAWIQVLEPMIMGAALISGSVAGATAAAAYYLPILVVHKVRLTGHLLWD